jgi:hypothetical protein
MDGVFSKEVKDIIAQSRDIALSLGYDYISTVHFFLADCKINNASSIKMFAFNTDQDFQAFYVNQKADEPILLAEDLPLTVEAEKTIRKAFKLWSHNNSFDKVIRPYHLFLAAALLPETLFCSIFPQEYQLYEKVEEYYIKTGQIEKDSVYKSLWMRYRRKVLKFFSSH